MQGLIRIPGAPASNFDTGQGLTVVDLINVGNDAKGYAEIFAVEIVFTQAAPRSWAKTTSEKMSMLLSFGGDRPPATSK
ncbi:hypothetical protein [Bradyrhizobium tunisiense]|uniref:hypothetical protein n=1 Tax=Bradyrhizobium tunisiense TaxID=3278709 RepID=UPI0035E055BD